MTEKTHTIDIPVKILSEVRAYIAGYREKANPTDPNVVIKQKKTQTVHVPIDLLDEVKGLIARYKQALAPTNTEGKVKKPTRRIGITAVRTPIGAIKGVKALVSGYKEKKREQKHILR